MPLDTINISDKDMPTSLFGPKEIRQSRNYQKLLDESRYDLEDLFNNIASFHVPIV